MATDTIQHIRSSFVFSLAPFSSIFPKLRSCAILGTSSRLHATNIPTPPITIGAALNATKIQACNTKDHAHWYEFYASVVAAEAREKEVINTNIQLTNDRIPDGREADSCITPYRSFGRGHHSLMCHLELEVPRDLVCQSDFVVSVNDRHDHEVANLVHSSFRNTHAPATIRKLCPRHRSRQTNSSSTTSSIWTFEVHVAKTL